MAFHIVELTLDADDNVIERRVVPYPYPTREEAVTAIECIVSTFAVRVTSRRRSSGGQLLTMVTARGSSSKVSEHKMTDDEIREALRLDFEQTADWRRSKAAEYPEDSRNLEAAALLDKLAASVETVAPDLLEAYGSLRDDYMDSEQHSEMFRQIGFHSWPETAEDFVKACIADRAMGA